MNSYGGVGYHASCPRCGYCPHCGRSNDSAWYPNQYPNQYPNFNPYSQAIDDYYARLADSAAGRNAPATPPPKDPAKVGE